MSNFLGKPFDPWVKDQIEVRQESLGKYTNIPPKDIQNYTTKAPFLRLASSINLTNQGSEGNEIEDSVLKKLIASGVSEELIKDNLLAKNFILQGGVTNSEGKMQFGLNKGSNFDGAYGWGGISNNSRGYVPMPGITDADVTYYNNGALSKTTINIKCFSKEQFQLIDVLYLRPGYTLLLEFGHSQYLKKKDGKVTLESFPNFLTNPMSLLLGGSSGLKGETSQYELVKSINKTKKQHQGNYEGIFGKITKFNWQFNPDGSYDCQVQLTSVGDVIESLKINLTTPKSVEESLGSFFGKAWSNFWRVLSAGGSSVLITNADKTIINSFLYGIFQGSQESITHSLSKKDAGFQSLEVGNFRDDKGEFPKTLTYPKGLLYRTGITYPKEEKSSNPLIYIKYGAFLAFIQSNLLLYNTKTNTPQFTFDMNFEDLANDDNVILRIPGQLSTDPRVCLIPYENFSIVNEGGSTIGMKDVKINELLKQTDFFYKNEQYLGRLGNIMVSTTYIAEVLDSMNTDEEGSVLLFEFLKTLQKGMIEATGGINKYDLRMNQEGTKVQFIEEIPQRLTNPPSKTEYTRFNVFGVKRGINGSFIREINLTADLSNDFATMISIGAQSNSNQLNGNATSFSNYNAGLIDRIIPEKVSSPDIEEQKKTKKVFKPNQLAKIVSKEKENYISIYQNTQFNEEDISSYKSNMTTAISLALGILTDRKAKKEAQLQAPFFLPFNLTLTMDGISGMKLYQKFLITDDILPPSYEKDGVDIQLKGINHKIDVSGWETTLETLSVPANPLSPIKRPPQLTSEDKGETAGSNPLPSKSIVPSGTTFPNSSTRENAMLKSYNGVFARDPQVPKMCARWTYNLALNYVSFLKGGQLKNPQIASGGDARWDVKFHANLTKLGYKKTTSTGLSRIEVGNLIKNETWGYGDVIVYWANDKPTSGSDTHYVYGHAQIYVGSINSSGWASSMKNNYNAKTGFVYGTRKSNNWNLLVFRAPYDANGNA